MVKSFLLGLLFLTLSQSAYLTNQPRLSSQDIFSTKLIQTHLTEEDCVLPDGTECSDDYSTTNSNVDSDDEETVPVTDLEETTETEIIQEEEDVVVDMGLSEDGGSYAGGDQAYGPDDMEDEGLPGESDDVISETEEVVEEEEEEIEPPEENTESVTNEPPGNVEVEAVEDNADEPDASSEVDNLLVPETAEDTETGTQDITESTEGNNAEEDTEETNSGTLSLDNIVADDSDEIEITSTELETDVSTTGVPDTSNTSDSDDNIVGDDTEGNNADVEVEEQTIIEDSDSTIEGIESYETTMIDADSTSTETESLVILEEEETSETETSTVGSMSDEMTTTENNDMEISVSVDVEEEDNLVDGQNIDDGAIVACSEDECVVAY